MEKAIVKIEQELISAKNAEPLEVRMDNTTFPPLYRIPEETARLALLQIVHAAYQYRGQQADELVEGFLAASLYDELMADREGVGTKYLKMPEIARTLRAACLGIKGELYGINVASLYKNLYEFCVGEGRMLQSEWERLERTRRTQRFDKSIYAAAMKADAKKLAKQLK